MPFHPSIFSRFVFAHTEYNVLYTLAYTREEDSAFPTIWLPILALFTSGQKQNAGQKQNSFPFFNRLFNKRSCGSAYNAKEAAKIAVTVFGGISFKPYNE